MSHMRATMRAMDDSPELFAVFVPPDNALEARMMGHHAPPVIAVGTSPRSLSMYQGDGFWVVRSESDETDADGQPRVRPYVVYSGWGTREEAVQHLLDVHDRMDELHAGTSDGPCWYSDIWCPRVLEQRYGDDETEY